MQAANLVEQVSELLPENSPVEHLRMALLVALQVDDLNALSDAQTLRANCQEMRLKLGAATDQHGAIAGELDALGANHPCDFSTDHLWTLVRAIKVQSQVLNLYLGPRDEPAHLG